MPDAKKRWLNILKELLSKNYSKIEFNIINSGVGGNSDREKMMRFDKDVIAYHPDFLLLEFGGNNTCFDNPERRVEIEESAELLKKIREKLPPHTRINVITFPVVLDEQHQVVNKHGAKEYFAKFGGLDVLVESYRELTREYARNNAFPLVDLSFEMRKSDNPCQYTLDDGVHLNAAGNQLLADMVFQALSEQINEMLIPRKERPQ